MKRILSLILLTPALSWATAICSPATIAGSEACLTSGTSTTAVTVIAKGTGQTDFTVVPDGTGHLLIKKPNGQCVGFRQTTIQNPAEAALARVCSTVTDGDRWSAIKAAAGDTTFRLVNKLNGLLLGATSDTPASGSSVTGWSADGSNAQKFRFSDGARPAKAADTTVKTFRVSNGIPQADGQTVAVGLELDCSDSFGTACKVPGSSPSRYATARAFAAGVRVADMGSITIAVDSGGSGGGSASAWTGGIVTAAFSGLTNSGPIVATSNQVIQGLNISNATGDCIIIPEGVINVTIRGNNIGPCERTAFNNGDNAGFGVHIRGTTSRSHTIEANYFDNMALAVMVQGSGDTKILRNGGKNIYGGNLAPGGSRYLPAIQFNAHSGTAGRSLVACNVFDASTWTIAPTSTRPGIEDGFSTNSSSNVTYRYNKLRGDPSRGYNSPTGSCISLGDDSGNNNQARDNVCVKTPNHGVFTAGGDNHIIENNIAFEIGVSGSNTGLSFAAGEFQGQESKNVLFRGNRGYAAYWNNGGTGAIDAWGSFFTWVSGRDVAPDRSVDGLVLYGNNFRDTTLTEASAWGTTYAACNGTGAIPSGDIAFPQVAQTIPLQSTITTRTVPYPRSVASNFQGKVKFEAFNNNWTANGNNGNNTLNNNPGWSQSIGLDGLQPNHTVNLRIKWSYPQQYAGQEVLNYPGLVEGRGATTSASTPQAGAKLPALVSTITSYRSGYASAAGPMSGLGHLTYDLWLSDSPNWTGNESNGTKHRIAEIMKPTRIVGAYGIPNTPAGAAIGRNCTGVGTSATTCWGRNPSIWKGRYTIDGVQYDVYHAPPNSPATGLSWNFVVFMPLTFPGTGPETTNWKPLLEFLNGQNWLTHHTTGAAVTVNNTYLNALELGVEAINPNSYDLATGGSTGDIQIMGFWTEFNGSRY